MRYAMAGISRGLHMDEKALRSLITDVKDGRLSRRGFVQKMVALGLTGPMAAQVVIAGECFRRHGIGAERSPGRHPISARLAATFTAFLQ